MSISTFLRTPYNGATVNDNDVATGGDGSIQGGNTGTLLISTLSSGSALWKSDTRFGGARMVTFTNTAGQGAFANSPLPTSTYKPGVAFDFVCPALADGASTPLTIATLRNGGNTIQLRITSTGTVDLFTGSSGSGVSAAAPTKPGGGTMNALVPGQLYRAEMFSNGSSATVGTATVRMRVYAYGADAATYLGDTSTTTAATGTNPYTAGIVGILSYATVRNFTVSNVRYDDNASDFMGPLVAANQAPTVSLPAVQTVAAGSTVTLTRTAADSDGTVMSTSWALLPPSSNDINIGSATGASVSFTAGPAGSLYIVQCTVTDNGGATATANTEVRVVSTGDAVPLPNNLSTGFVRTGGATDAGALADSDDGTYLETPNAVSATPQAVRMRLTPITTRSGVTVTARLRKNGSSSCTAAISLQQGTTDKGSLGFIALTDTWADYTLTLSSAQVAAITDWGSLYGVVSFTA